MSLACVSFHPKWAKSSSSMRPLHAQNSDNESMYNMHCMYQMGHVMEDIRLHWITHLSIRHLRYATAMVLHSVVAWPRASRHYTVIKIIRISFLFYTKCHLSYLQHLIEGSISTTYLHIRCHFLSTFMETVKWERPLNRRHRGSRTCAASIVHGTKPRILVMPHHVSVNR